MWSRIKKMVYHTGVYAKYDRFKTSRLRQEIIKKGLKHLIDLDWTGLKTSDTIYILGSGLSVMDLSDEDWLKVDAHDSFGFNGWLFHDFTPTFYGIEPMANDAVFEKYIEALKQKQSQYKSTPVIIQYQHLKLRNKSFKVDGLSPENLYYNAPYMPNTTNPKVLKAYINKWVESGSSKFSEIIHYSGSLSYAITMSYLMGYKNIVLLGVDLNSSEYFYSSPKAGELAQQFYKFQNNRPKIEKLDKKAAHYTLSTKVTGDYGCLPISYFIEYFSEAVNKKGVKLSIGSEKSALFPMLDLHTFS